METNDKLVTVQTCNEMFNAELTVGRLEANGIRAAIRNCSGTAYLSSPYAATGSFEVVVLSSDLAAAQQALAE